MTRPIDSIVIHCAATPNGRATTAAEVDRWHAERGFKRSAEWRAKQNPELGSIGYHFFIRITGTVETGRHLDEVGAHVQGANSRAIGICLAGTDRFTRAQWDTLAKMIAALKKKYPGARVLGHRDFSPDQNGDGILEPWEWNKLCPGFDVAAWLANGMEPALVHVLEDQQ